MYNQLLAALISPNTNCTFQIWLLCMEVWR